MVGRCQVHNGKVEKPRLFPVRLQAEAVGEAVFYLAGRPTGRRRYGLDGRDYTRKQKNTRTSADRRAAVFRIPPPPL